jgi:hypothetical protein
LREKKRRKNNWIPIVEKKSINTIPIMKMMIFVSTDFIPSG